MSTSSPPRGAAWLLVGLVLVLAYWVLTGMLPRGSQEFAYAPFTPAPVFFSAMRGFTVEQAARHLGAIVLLGPALLLVTKGALGAEGDALPRLSLRRMVLAASGLSLAVSAAVMLGVFHGPLGARAFVDDELTYGFQAELLALGELGVPGWPELGQHYDVFMIHGGQGWTGKYLFGEPLVQAVGTLVGVPALLHLPLAGLTLWLFHGALRRTAGAQVAGVATALLALSPMFMLTNATGLAQTTALFCMVVAGAGVVQVERGRVLGGAVATAMALGFGLTVRPQTIGPAGLVLALWVAGRCVQKRNWSALGLSTAVGVSWLGLIGAYNHAITGDALELPWNLWRPVEHWGFGEIWAEGPNSGYRHNLARALENVGVTAIRLNHWWLGWPLGLGLLAVWWRFGRRTQGLAVWGASAGASALFMFGYYSTGVSDTGPIYSFELLLPLSVLGAHALISAHARFPRATMAAVVVHLGLGTAGFLVEQITRLDRLMYQIHGPTEALVSQVEPPAVIFHEVIPAEVRRAGWVLSRFPRRSVRAPYVYLPRNTRDDHPAFVERAFPGHACWYYRFDQDARRPTLTRCEEAVPLMTRTQMDDRSRLFIPSTALRLGWPDGWTWLGEQYDVPVLLPPAESQGDSR